MLLGYIRLVLEECSDSWLINLGGEAKSLHEGLVIVVFSVDIQVSRHEGLETSLESALV